MSSLRKMLFIVLLSILSFAGIIYLFLSRSSRHLLFTAKVKINIFNYYDKAPIEGLKIIANLTTQTNQTFILSGFSDKNGTISMENFPLTSDSLLSISSIVLYGKWVLIELNGNETINAAVQKWHAADPQFFAFNFSKYIFNGVILSRYIDDSKLIFEATLYLAPGRVLEIYNPILNVEAFDKHAKIILLNTNFVEFEKSNLAVIPCNKPVAFAGKVSYFAVGFPFSWHFNVTIDVGNKKFVDFSSSLVREISLSQIKEIRRMLDALKPYGFDLVDQYNKLAKISEYYEKASLAIEGMNYREAFSNLQLAASLYFDVFTTIARIYTSALRWSISLLLILLLFALMVSKLLTEKKKITNLLFVLSFLAIFSLFALTQPYLKIMISSPSTLIQNTTFTSGFLIEILLIVPVMIFILLLIGLDSLREFIWETFEVSMRNLRRRKMRTGLVLLTIVVVSTSSMCLLTFATLRPSYSFSLPNFKPVINNAIVVYKREIRRAINPSPVMPPQIETYIPFQLHEVAWFLNQEWVKAINIYGIKKVSFSRTDGFALNNFSTVSLIIVNPDFMEKYCNISCTLRVNWFTSQDKENVLIGSKISKFYNLSTGSEILINDKKFVIKSIFEEEKLINNVKDVDGDFFLFKILDPLTRKIEDESIIIGSLDDLDLDEFTVYRISIVLKEDYSKNLTSVVEHVINFGYEFYETTEFRIVNTYLVRATMNGKTILFYSDAPSITFAGPWQTQLFLWILTGLFIFANTLGSMVERRNEIRTFHLIGASPTRIKTIFVIEGLTQGIVGGIFSYVLGFIFVKSINFVPSIIVREMIVSESPFIVAMIVATATSIAGCFLPSQMSMQSVVPSGRLQQKIKDIIIMKNGEAYLEIPLKITRDEINLLRIFLEEFLNKRSVLKSVGLEIEEFSEENRHNAALSIILILGYKSNVNGQASYFEVLLETEADGLLRMIIRPLDSWTKKRGHWTPKHRENLGDLSAFLRRELLGFIDWKRKRSLP